MKMSGLFVWCYVNRFHSSGEVENKNLHENKLRWFVSVLQN